MSDRPEGIHHRHRDYYSESSPIPSIQRFFKKGLSEVIAKRNEADSESDSDETDNGQDAAAELDAHLARAQQAEAAKLSSQKAVESGETSRKKSTKKRMSSLLSGSKHSQENDQDHADDKDTSLRAEPEERQVDESGKQAHRRPEEVDKAYKRSRKPRQVQDPITGQTTWVHDIGKREYRRTLRMADAGDAAGRENVLRSRLADNVTSQAFPPAQPLPDSVSKIHPGLLPVFALWALLTGLGWVPPLISVALNAWMLWWAWRTLLSGAEDQRWHQERLRGEQTRAFDTRAQGEGDDSYSQGISEGAEWLNAILDSLWSVMNPELFSTLGGTLEDVMQASIPGFIHSVKVEDLAQGSTPVRITGLRILPEDHVESLKQDMRKHVKEQQRDLGSAPREDESGTGNHHTESIIEREAKRQEEAGTGEQYVNLELAFVYRARPTSSTVGAKGRNAHLLIKFWIGARKLLMLPLPVWVEIKGFVGVVRARVQLTSDPPFVKNVTFTFCGLPRVGIEVVPLHINTSHIPFLSSFIESSIDAAVGEFVMPSSLTMDVGEMLMGDNIKREVNALGVVVVYIHSAEDLEAQDLRGGSDPYCTLSLAKVGKILYSTRVVLSELSPRWEERHVILVTREHLDSQDKVSIALWDSDRFSADDMLGCAEVPLVDLAKHPNRLYRRRDTLKGLDRERTKQGTVSWSLGFFSKAPSTRKPEGAKTADKDKSEDRKAEGNDQAAARDSRNAHAGDQETDVEVDSEPERDGRELEDGTIEKDSPLSQAAIDEERKKQTRHQATAVDFEPPDPRLPSGILSLQIHQIAGLEVTDHHRSKRPRRQNEPGQDVEAAETENDPDEAPSAYARIILNDEIVFQTRTKALNSNPFYNAGTERFIRDWRRTLVMVVVYDFRVREADAILGVVPIKLSELFKQSSQVTQFFPLAGGVGHGRIRLSLLFRPIQHTSRARKKLGWNIGTVRLLSSPVATDFDEAKGASAHDVHLVALRASTLAGSAKIAANRARYVDRESKDAVEWGLDEAEFPYKVPARRRYAAPYVIEFRALSALGKRKTILMSIIWMQDMLDDDVADMRLPIWRPLPGNDFHRLRQNYHNYKNEAEAEALGVERIGYLHVKMQFKSGLGKIHTKFDNNPGAKIVMDAWRVCTALGLRSVSGDFANARLNEDGYLEDVDEADRESEPGEAYSSDSDNENDREPRARASKASGDPTLGEDSGEARGSSSSADLDTPDGSGVERSRSLKQKFAEWKAEKDELHRQHKGIKQYKPVRTLDWVGQTAKSAGAGLKNKFDLQDRRSQHVETEL